MLILQPEVYKILAADEKGYPARKQLYLSLLQSHKEILHILQSFPSDKFVPFPAKKHESSYRKPGHGESSQV